MFSLQTATPPINNLGQQADPGTGLAAWSRYFVTFLAANQASLGLTGTARVSSDVATKIVGRAVPADNPSMLILLAKFGADAYNLAIVLDRSLPAETVRFD
jgi:hypothetical protein